MNRKLKSQIKTYAGIAGAILSAEKLNAQVMYVDVNPDSLVAGAICDSLYEFYIDVDNDFINDFELKAERNCFSNSASAYVKIMPLSQNKVNNAFYHAGWWSDTDTALNVMKLNPGDTINGNGYWLASEKFLWSFGVGSVASDEWSQGAWQPFSDGCLPFLLFKNSQNYYGWMHIQILSHSTFILKDYAYQLQPNVPMLACDTTNLATSISENNPQFNFSQQNNLIHISTLQNLNNAKTSVYDLLGKEILQQPFAGKETTVSIDRKGIYVIEVRSEKGIFRKKIFTW